MASRHGQGQLYLYLYYQHTERHFKDVQFGKNWVTYSKACMIRTSSTGTISCTQMSVRPGTVRYVVFRFGFTYVYPPSYGPTGQWWPPPSCVYPSVLCNQKPIFVRSGCTCFGKYKLTLCTEFLCPLLKRMQLTCTVWVESVNTHTMVRGKHIDTVKKISFCHCAMFFSFITSRKSNLCTALTIESNCINSHTQHTTALRPNVFLIGIHQLLVTNEGQLPFLSVNHY
jgi:hypothetical protein